MIDVSDGLVQDLGHLCRASGVAADIELGRLPVAPRCRRTLGRSAAAFAATAGEDYELLFALSPRREPALARMRAGLHCRVTRIGRVRSGRPGVRVLDPAGRAVMLGRRGFDHFR
jgi:thiamine-monophosphate kinase